MPAGPAPAPPESAGRVLVVDDSGFNRTVIAGQIAQLGHQATMAEDGQEAIALLTGSHFDLVLLDIVMPGMDGYIVLARMKADSALRDIPVIMISGVDELESVVRCIELGAEDYLTKPFEPVLLRARIKACLEQKRLRDQERRYLQQVAQLTQAAAAVEDESFNPATLNDLAARPDELGKLARVFQRMARGVATREQQLKREVCELRIEIDHVHAARQAAVITETDSFRRLQQRAHHTRARRADPSPAAAPGAGDV
jgi:CheY-like chemotaxis protein